jgi:sec-independent protein translocase protein TatB
MRRIGQRLQGIGRIGGDRCQQQATVVDDYLRDEASNVNKVVAAMATTEGERPVTAPR